MKCWKWSFAASTYHNEWHNTEQTSHELTWNAFIITENRLLVRYADKMRQEIIDMEEYTDVCIVVWGSQLLAFGTWAIYMNISDEMAANHSTIQYSTQYFTIYASTIHHTPYGVQWTLFTMFMMFHFLFKCNVVFDPDYFWLYFASGWKTSEFHVRKYIIIFSWNQQCQSI